MSQPQGAEGGDADPQPPSGHLLVLESTDSACPSSWAAPGNTAVTPGETSVPGGGGGYHTRSTGYPVPYSLGPRESVVFDERLLPKGQSSVAESHRVHTDPGTTWRRTHAQEGDRERSAAYSRSEGAKHKARWRGTPTGRTSRRPVERDSGGQPYPLGQWTGWQTP